MTNDEWLEFTNKYCDSRADPAGFATWMHEVNRAIERKTGLRSEDLPDYCYRDAFDDGARPAQVAIAAIRAAKDY